MYRSGNGIAGRETDTKQAFESSWYADRELIDYHYCTAFPRLGGLERKGEGAGGGMKRPPVYTYTVYLIEVDT